MTELIVKVQRKALLEQQRMELLQEKKQLEKEVFDLKIAAHNEQVDVEALERFSVKGLLLKMTGKHEEMLETERREARTVKAKYDMAAARLERVCTQLAQIDRELPELAGCENALSAALTEKLGYVPCSEEAALVTSLEAVLEDGARLQEAGSALDYALNTALTWMGTNPSILPFSGKLQQAEAVAQEKLDIYLSMLAAFSQKLAEQGCTLDTLEFSPFGKSYLLDLSTDNLLDSRCSKVQQALTGIGWQWKTLLPRLDSRLHRARIDWLNALYHAGKA